MLTSPATTVNTAPGEPDGTAYCPGLDVSRTGVGRDGLCATACGTNTWRWCGLSHIMADSRQIIWRESLRSRCKHSTRAQTVLPHNLAWLFLPFLPWCGRHGSAAMICGRKRPLTLKLASILKKMVLPDNVALSVFSHIFLRTDTQSWCKHVFGRSRHIMCQKWRVSAGKTMTFACVLSWFLPHYPYP